MPIKSRVALKEIFRSDAVPTGEDFKDLIDSMLNMRDDHFFGKWQANRAYRNNDVVIHGKSIYILLTEENPEEECGDDNTVPQSNSYCNNIVPPDDKNWCELQLELEDGDWAILPKGDGEMPTYMLAKVYAEGVGIGMEDKNDLHGQFHVWNWDRDTGEKNGDYIFGPHDSDIPDFKIINSSLENERYLSSQVNTDEALWITNTPIGFVFKKMDEAGNTPLQLMLATSTDDRPRVGIGTDSPIATLDVKKEQAHLLALSPAKAEPILLLLNSETITGVSYLATSVEEDHALITTNAQKGIRFGKGGDFADLSDGSNAIEHWLSITKEGHVGIGTIEPSAKLEVTDGTSGRFKMSLNNTNPAFSITNIRPSANNYLAMGTDNDKAIFLTDSADGFFFGKGEDCTNHGGQEENINQDNAELLMSISPNKKVAVGKKAIDDFELDVRGKMRSFGMYLDTNNERINKVEDLGEVMEKIKLLNPIVFKWNNTTNCADEGDQIGFFAHELDDHFPKLVRKNSVDQTHSIAYQNMVAVLVKALQEQDATICELKDRVANLEKICGDA